ncbi:MAG TPA: PTS system mannose/fructose/sorbose family transporter subunit IID [Gemmatimonadales bacterium]|nr:PTS system mannose/fructose/sorbose family transporter subunit IID [Gemmatimonadales bacterium]
MKGRRAALRRLYAVQGAWNYERMLGIGMGHAAEPLLDDLGRSDPERHREAVVRSAEFFNSHPYLAGLALGAAVRGEYDRVPGAQISRLRTALCSPLGALGDQLFWAGAVPATVAAAVAAVTLGAGPWSVVVLLIAFNLFRAWVAAWALRTGLESGTAVGAAIRQSWLPRAAHLAGIGAGLAIGIAVPLVADWFLSPFQRGGIIGALALAAGGVITARLAGPMYAAPRFALCALAAALVFRLVIR